MFYELLEMTDFSLPNSRDKQRYIDKIADAINHGGFVGHPREHLLVCLTGGTDLHFHHIGKMFQQLKYNWGEGMVRFTMNSA